MVTLDVDDEYVKGPKNVSSGNDGSYGGGGDGAFPGQNPTSPLKTPALALHEAQYAPKPAMSCVYAGAAQGASLPGRSWQPPLKHDANAW